MADKITVLLVDDHALVRKGFRRMLEDDPAITVVGEANDGNDAVKLALQLKPSVTVMDCALPGISAMDLDLLKAVKGVAEGKQVLDPQLVKPEALKGERESGLTARELEILQHIVAGESNKEIAADLGLSANTVAVHRANIMDALGIHKTAELVVYAIRNGLVTLP
jgi:DNA-binding NarL/FixJ family response regulator